MKTIETVGKDIESALMAGLAELGCKLDDVEVKILEHPGLFRKARIRMTYQGNDATVEKKTAAAVMRNLEERAARVASERDERPQGKMNDRNRKNDRRDRNETAVGDRNRNGQNPRERQNEPRPQPHAKEATPVARDRKPADAEKPPKSEFRRDFRAELEAAGNNANNADARKNDRPERSDMNRRRPEPPREAVSHEVLAAAKEKIAAYLKELTALMGMPSDVTAEIRNGGVEATLPAADENLVGARGETLEALEHLATMTANGGDNRNVRLSLDCGGYRARLADDLAKSAIEAADKAAATGKRVELPPMSSSGRRVVHAALGNREDVITRSEGREPNRYIVIMPKRAGDNGGANGNRRQGGGFNNNRRNNKHWNNHGRNNGGKGSGAE